MTQIADPPTTSAVAGADRLGLPQSTALVLGSIIGVGIFSLPDALASYGPISLFAMALATVGAVALAVMFSAMSRRMPADGGPCAYARAAFGNGLGFTNAWSYWITVWAGNAVIVVGWVSYVERFLNKSSVPGWSIVIALIGLWIPAAVNLTGLRNMGSFQLWTTVLKFIPLVVMSSVGLLFHQGRPFHALEHQRRVGSERHRRSDGHLLVQLPGGRDGLCRRGQGA